MPGWHRALMAQISCMAAVAEVKWTFITARPKDARQMLQRSGSRPPALSHSASCQHSKVCAHHAMTMVKVVTWAAYALLC